MRTSQKTKNSCQIFETETSAVLGFDVILSFWKVLTIHRFNFLRRKAIRKNSEIYQNLSRYTFVAARPNGHEDQSLIPRYRIKSSENFQMDKKLKLAKIWNCQKWRGCHLLSPKKPAKIVLTQTQVSILNTGVPLFFQKWIWVIFRRVFRYITEINVKKIKEAEIARFPNFSRLETYSVFFEGNPTVGDNRLNFSRNLLQVLDLLDILPVYKTSNLQKKNHETSILKVLSE